MTKQFLPSIQTLPPSKRQPNLVFAATRYHGATDSYLSFRSTLLERWDVVRQTILSRSTQTNEAARCAVLLPFLAALLQPLALVEVGASAGLCLLPDRYSYRYDNGTALDPVGGPSGVVIACQLDQGISPPQRMPEVVWRVGIDLSPVDVNNQDEGAWLDTLVWPEHVERRERLHRALALARRDPPRVVRGDLLEVLPGLAAQAPSNATLVIFHSAVLVYLDPNARLRFIDIVGDMPGHWISNEGHGVVPGIPMPPVNDGRFTLAVDGKPQARTDPHGRSIRPFAER